MIIYYFYFATIIVFNLAAALEESTTSSSIRGSSSAAIDIDILKQKQYQQRNLQKQSCYNEGQGCNSKKICCKEQQPALSCINNVCSTIVATPPPTSPPKMKPTEVSFSCCMIVAVAGGDTFINFFSVCIHLSTIIICNIFLQIGSHKCSGSDGQPNHTCPDTHWVSHLYLQEFILMYKSLSLNAV